MVSFLLVEDDEALARGIMMVLESEDNQFRYCRNCREARKAVEQEEYDLMLFDINLPDGNGLELCRFIRQRSASVPIIFLTALDTEIDEVAGFQAGADDYITKPFSLAILRERVSAALRRNRAEKNDVIVMGPFQFDFSNQIYKKNNKEILLSRTESKVLYLLVKNKENTMSRELLLDKVWGNEGEFIEENSLSVTVKRLRDKLEDNPKKPSFIQTVYGIGYKLVTPDQK